MSGAPSIGMFSAFWDRYPRSAIMDRAKAEEAFDRLPPGARIVATMLAPSYGRLCAELGRRKPRAAHDWLAEVGATSASSGVEALRRLREVVFEQLPTDGDARNNDFRCAQSVAGLGAAAAEDETQDSVILDDVDGVAEHLDRALHKIALPGLLAVFRKIIIDRHASTPSVGVGTPMVDESAADSFPASAADSDVLRGGRAE